MAELDERLAAALRSFYASSPSQSDRRSIEEMVEEFRQGDIGRADLAGELRDLGFDPDPRQRPVQQARPNRGPPHAHAGARLGAAPAAGQDVSAYVTAAYRFVPYHPDAIVLPEQGADGPLNEIRAGAVDARIDLVLETHEPLLVGGGKSADDPVIKPLMVDGQPVIPGATLRGMIRSVAEIIGGARLRLGQVNHGQVLPLRDFTHSDYANQSGHYPLGNPKEVKAAWLTVSDIKPGDEALEQATAFLEPVDAWGAIRVSQAEKGSKLLAKYQRAGLTEGRDGAAMIVTADRQKTFIRLGDRNSIAMFEPATGGLVKGHLVFSDVGPPAGRDITERNEYVFLAGPAATPVKLGSDIWKTFVRLNSRPVGDKLRPQAAWAEFARMARQRPGLKIPVFFVGDLAHQTARPFAIGLTRLFKVPHRHSLEDGLKASGVTAPRLQRGARGQELAPGEIDMVENLFGYVHEPDDAAGDGAQAPGGLARKGRVAFSMARADEATVRLADQVVTTVEGAPRPSFGPFYLAGPVPDWSAQKVPRIAGRKRYPARHTQGFTSIRDTLRARVAGGPDAENTDTQSRLRFLVPARQGQPIRFTASIRLANVTPAELGLVLSAVTLGGLKAGQARRHGLGRAKNAGAGQVAALVSRLVVEELATGAITGWTPDAADPQARHPDQWIADFEGHVARALDQRALGKLKSAREALYATCSPGWFAPESLVDNATRRDGSGKFKATGFKELRVAVKPLKPLKPGQSRKARLSPDQETTLRQGGALLHPESRTKG